MPITRARLLPALLVLALGCKDQAPESNSGEAQPTAQDDAKTKPAPEPEPDKEPEADDGGEPAEPSLQLEPAQKLTADIPALVDALGNRALLTFALRPSQWKATQPGLKAVVEGMPEPQLVEAASSPTFGDALKKLGELAVGQDLGTLTGFDASKPIVGALFEAPPAAEGDSLFDLLDTARSPGTRHVLLVPVTDGKAFIDWLTTSPVMSSAKSLPNWLEGEGPALTAHLPEIGYVVVGIEGEYARITILSGTEDVPAENAKALLLPRVRPPVTAPVDTPALAELVEGDSVAALHVRPWRLVELAEYRGVTEMARAMSNLPPELEAQRAVMIAKGMALVLTPEFFVSGSKAEFDDWTYLVRASTEQASLAAVASLTPHGRAMWDAGKTDVTALPLAAKGAPLDGFVRLDLAKMFAAAPPKPGLDPRDSGLTGELWSVYWECGFACPVHAFHRAPIQLASTAVAAARLPGGIPPVMVAQFAMTSIDPPKAGFATVFEPATGAGQAKTALESLAGADFLTEASVTEAKRGSQGVLMGGFEVAPKKVFALDERPGDALLYVAGTASGSAFPAFMSGMSAALQIDRRGPVLVAQAAVRRGAAPVLDFAPDHSTATWPSPVVAYPGADQAECLALAAGQLRAAFSEVASAAADQRTELLRKRMDELGDAFECKDGTPEVRERAKRLQATMSALLTQIAGPPTP